MLTRWWRRRTDAQRLQLPPLAIHEPRSHVRTDLPYDWARSGGWPAR